MARFSPPYPSFPQNPRGRPGEFRHCCFGAFEPVLHQKSPCPGLSRASTSLPEPAPRWKKTWVAGSSPATGYLWLLRKLLVGVARVILDGVPNVLYSAGPVTSDQEIARWNSAISAALASSSRRSASAATISEIAPIGKRR